MTSMPPRQQQPASTNDNTWAESSPETSPGSLVAQYATINVDTPMDLENHDISSSPSKKRFIVPRACDRCKRLRRGCSEYRPCRRCTDAGVADQCQVVTTAVTSDASPGDLQSAYRRLSELVSVTIIDHCAAIFFERLYPTIPILIPEYISRLKADAFSSLSIENLGRVKSLCVLVAMCGQVLLQTGGSEDLFNQGLIPEGGQAFGQMLLDALVSVYQILPRYTPVTIQSCLTSFFLYACETGLSHHSRAFQFLREATTLLLLFQLNNATDNLDRLIHGRLFWVLLISERSHAIRYRRPITMQITAETPSLDTTDPQLAGFWSLAALFSPIDTSFVAVFNHEVISISVTPESLDNVESRVNLALSPLRLDLHDTQKANLRVTQLWLRIIIWKLRLHLGYLVEDSYQHNLTFRYPIDVAKDLMLSTSDLLPSSLEVHGVGMTEKLFDVASALVDVLARIPINSPSLNRNAAMDTLPEDVLSYLRNLIRKLPEGEGVYDDLIEKHIQQTAPNLATERFKK
ncbi:GAL4 [Geosmithia morbida]|uniref:GAL4 n=1 Tax=Geosmithia morbida TaxID=1094350 RepID=A0A9P4Z2F5_9HYPO|nr:GAL4 [Geosmithia morbida]KAF4126221.1 GAL4 [Geosmithia morbida]